MTKLRNYHSEQEVREIMALGPSESRRRLKGGVWHSPEEIAAFHEQFASRPGYERVMVMVEYAREQGGLTLECLRLINGLWFREPWVMTPAAVADELGVPFETVDRVLREADEAIQKRLGGTAEK
jgi:hypothetical protein